MPNSYRAPRVETRDGSVIAIVSEPNLEAAERELVSLVWAVMEDQAQDGKDPFSELLEAPPTSGAHVSFLPSELVSIHLKLARAQANLRHADMAERMGITQQAYAKLERPGAILTLRTLILLERVLGRELVAWPRRSSAHS